MCAPRAVPAYLKPAAAAPSSLGSLSPVHGTHGIPGRTARAIELTLGWSGRELSESLFETLIGSFNPSYTKGLGGLHSGYAKLTTSKTSLKSTFTFHHFSYLAGVTISDGRIVATTFNRFVGKLGGVAIRFTISHAQALALTASAAR
jgi:hypothetical protein